MRRRRTQPTASSGAAAAAARQGEAAVGTRARVARPRRFIGAGRNRVGHGRPTAGKHWTPAAESRPGAVRLGLDGLHGGLVAGPTGLRLGQAGLRVRAGPKVTLC
jgi:hypothetical protein